MAKIKHTKTELKAQKDALSRYQRFLPMLQLKKQQLQMETMSLRVRLEALDTAVRDHEGAMDAWIGVLADAEADIPLRLHEVRTSTGNIAGVSIPLFDGLRTERVEIDLFETPAWVDEAAEVCERLAALRAEKAVLERQRELIEEELRTTAQRVNLFEKVKIPECKENIRVIRIHIGDEQTSAVVRGKIAKGRTAKPGSGDPLEEVA